MEKRTPMNASRKLMVMLFVYLPVCSFAADGIEMQSTTLSGSMSESAEVFFTADTIAHELGHNFFCVFAGQLKFTSDTGRPIDPVPVQFNPEVLHQTTTVSFMPLQSPRETIVVDLRMERTDCITPAKSVFTVSIHTFDSATGGSRASTESIWNFHVWNETH